MSDNANDYVLRLQYDGMKQHFENIEESLRGSITTLEGSNDALKRTVAAQEQTIAEMQGNIDTRAEIIASQEQRIAAMGGRKEEEP